MENKIREWMQTFIKDAAERKLPDETIQFIQMYLAELEFILSDPSN